MIRFHFLDATPCDRTLRRLAKCTPLKPPVITWASLFGV